MHQQTFTTVDCLGKMGESKVYEMQGEKRDYDTENRKEKFTLFSIGMTTLVLNLRMTVEHSRRRLSTTGTC